MVEFCRSCKSSLPMGDLTIRRGVTSTSHDYICPSCGKPANPAGARRPEPDADHDILISGGESRVE